jgi:hypothetical protein
VNAGGHRWDKGNSRGGERQQRGDGKPGERAGLARGWPGFWCQCRSLELPFLKICHPAAAGRRRTNNGQDVSQRKLLLPGSGCAW